MKFVFEDHNTPTANNQQTEGNEGTHKKHSGEVPQPSTQKTRIKRKTRTNPNVHQKANHASYTSTQKQPHTTIIIEEAPKQKQKDKAKAKTKMQIDVKWLCIIILAFLTSNILILNLFTESPEVRTERANLSNRLYLLGQASRYVNNVDGFEEKVRSVSQKLNVPPEWLMSVMYSESKFDAKVLNFKGSGAAGLIQWMPATAKDFGITTGELRKLDHVKQLDYVYKYLNRVRKKYGEFENLTQLYLAILYPKACNKNYCYTMYEYPSKAYKQNSGLDENKDKRVTVSDIDKRMKRVFKHAYMVGKD